MQYMYSTCNLSPPQHMPLPQYPVTYDLYSSCTPTRHRGRLPYGTCPPDTGGGSLWSTPTRPWGRLPYDTRPPDWGGSPMVHAHQTLGEAPLWYTPTRHRGRLPYGTRPPDRHWGRLPYGTCPPNTGEYSMHRYMYLVGVWNWSLSTYYCPPSLLPVPKWSSGRSSLSPL